MKASEARELIKENSLEELFEYIRRSAENGGNRCFLNPFEYVSDERKIKLIALGYKVYTTKDLNGLEGLVIEW